MNVSKMDMNHSRHGNQRTSSGSHDDHHKNNERGDKERRSSHYEEKKSSYDEEKKSSYDEERRSSYDEARRSSYYEEKRSSYDVEKRSSYDETRRSSYYEEKKSSYYEEKKSSYDEEKRSFHSEKSKRTASWKEKRSFDDEERRRRRHSSSSEGSSSPLKTKHRSKRSRRDKYRDTRETANSDTQDRCSHKDNNDYERRSHVMHGSTSEQGKYYSNNKSDSEEVDSEEEVMFEWENHKWELNQMFFKDNDVIQRGSEQYQDFFKFLKKYQTLKKQKKLKRILDKNINKEKPRGDKTAKLTEKFELPTRFDNKYLVNFGFKDVTVDSLIRRLPPRDLEDKKKRLSRKRIEEFITIILLYLNFNQKKSFEKLQKLRKCQKELPIAGYRDAILQTVADNSIVIVAGDTGCGKSTQVPQYLMQAGYSRVACTQPRRIACIALCKRVSHETLNEHGAQVGFQIRFERRTSDRTKIVFLTEGLLLRQVNSDAALAAYDVIILDEIHERHLHTDFLLGVVKCLLLQRSSLKIILMSATINLDLFSKYFLGKAPVIQVPGRLYPIQLQYFPIPMLEMTTKSDKLNPAPYVRVLQLIDNKYPEDERGDVLIFLSGFSEISTVVEAAKLYAQQTKRWIVMPLHSNLSVADQERVFDVPPEGVRKCVVSTNIAETSVTIDGVRFVVDSGKVKEMSYDAACKMQRLKEFWVSQASAEQRKGRAGRTGPGVCFRLYSEEQYRSFDAYSTPEIQRVPLDSIVLQMISMGLPDVRLFPFIQPPSMESLEASLRSLKGLAAVTSLALEAETTLSLAAAMSVQSVFTNRAERDPDCAAAVQELLSLQGDPFTLLNAYRGWLEQKWSRGGDSRRWCRTRGLEEQRFYELSKLRHQFTRLLQESKLHESPSVGRCSTAAERSRRHGELQQLRALKNKVDLQSTRQVKVLKVDNDGAALSDPETDAVDVKHVDFNLKHDPKQLELLLKNADVRSFKDVIMLKIILSSALYPNVAIADEHNTYKANSEQMFHTPNKPFATLHPTSVFAKHPDVLAVVDSDIVELPEFNSRSPAATRQQVLIYVSLLETNKVFLMNTFRAPTVQTLMMFANNIDTNADLSVMVFDKFIELRFPEASVAQNLVIQAVKLRTQWNELLELKLQLSKPDADELELLTSSGKLERVLSHGLIEFYLEEPLHSQRRLVAADVKVLHKGPGMEDAVLDPNPFTGLSCTQHESTGGMVLTEYLTYNSLLDTRCTVTTLTDVHSLCPECQQELYCTTLGRMNHIVNCQPTVNKRPGVDEDGDSAASGNSNAKKFYCEHCEQTLWLTIRQIFAHKQSHS
ncbi:probable ATP-dependent RNA helicase DHX34 [Hyalella azteca]|uniref:Probable ATP-dependent RNA helicase DHX34 n=1 Tax=Hyalella azteca TaxID=294128 RepID=A0A8B7PFW1_HYAAZ|nr:probable ATP-dependent RNA helicase DHX34 [Hyalella azteca]